MPTQRSRDTVSSLMSVMESEEVLLAKMALGFENLSKMVNSSIFISISSGTASMMRSASRMASWTEFAVVIKFTARSRTAASTLPRETPSAKALAIQARLSARRCGEISSRTVE